MKITTLIILFSNLSFLSFGQIVSSSCTSSDSIKALYQNDADRLTVRRIFNENLTYTDSIEIPQAQSDTILNAVLAVYNATSLPARDTVILQFNIHTFPYPVMNEIFLQADSTLFWMDSIQIGDLTTGQATIDELISFYEFFNVTYNATAWSVNDIVIFNSDSNYNLQPLVDSLNLIPGMSGASANEFIGDGNDITATIYADHVELIYNYGWGDCIAGCINNRYWKFKVYYDCSVEFVESYGNPIYYMDLKNRADLETTIYPNPFTDQINFSQIYGAFDYEIYNSLGQILISGTSQGNNISGLDCLESGEYIFVIRLGSITQAFRVVKK